MRTEGFQRATAGFTCFHALWSLPQERNPLQHEKSSRIGKKHTPKSASRKEVMGKNRKFPYRPFYHENPHLKSPKIPPIPCQARHGASKQGCKSAFGTLAAPLILFRHNRNGAVIVRFLVEALRIGCWRTRFGRLLSGRKRAHNGNQGASAYPSTSVSYTHLTLPTT